MMFTLVLCAKVSLFFGTYRKTFQRKRKVLGFRLRLLFQLIKMDLSVGTVSAS